MPIPRSVATFSPQTLQIPLPCLALLCQLHPLRRQPSFTIANMTLAFCSSYYRPPPYFLRHKHLNHPPHPRTLITRMPSTRPTCRMCLGLPQGLIDCGPLFHVKHFRLGEWSVSRETLRFPARSLRGPLKHSRFHCPVWLCCVNCIPCDASLHLR